MSTLIFPHVATPHYAVRHDDSYALTYPTMTSAADYRDFGNGKGKWVALSADGIVRCAYAKLLYTIEYADSVNRGELLTGLLPIVEVKWTKGL